MPLAMVTVNADRLGLRVVSVDCTLVNLGAFLRQEIAAALTCDDIGGDLATEDIEVTRDPRLDIGGEKYDIQVTIFANEFPSRKANLQDRCQKIREMLQKWCGTGNLKGYVWILLAPAAFEEF